METAAATFDVLSAILSESEITGVQVLEESAGRVVLDAFYHTRQEPRELHRNLRRRWTAWRQFPRDLRILGGIHFEPQDWVARWRDDYRPVRVGRHFLILPSWWEKEGRPSARWTLVLDPQNAFGSGTHASTRLCLLGLADFYNPGTRAVDIGTGSGILVIAMGLMSRLRSRRLAARPFLTAIDPDPDALRTARRNARRNHVGDLMRFRQAGIESFSAPPYPLVVANLTARDLEAQALRLTALSARGGLLLLSGLQKTDEPEVLRAFRFCGCRLLKTRRQEGWSLLVLAGPA